MENQTFILKKARTWSHAMTIFVKGVNGKLEKRQIKFGTEHLVRETDRLKNARNVQAQFITNDEILFDGMMRDSGYGKTFYLKGDPEGLKKRDGFNVTPLDSKKMALEALFKHADLPFDSTKSVEQLTEEYQIYMTAKTGAKIAPSTATEIPHKPVDVQQELQSQAEKAREAYFEKFGEEIPDEFRNDLGMLSALSDPNFDAKAYMESKKAPEEEKVSEDKTGLPADAASLGAIYFEEIGSNVPNPKKNDAAWIKAKILEKRGN